MTLIRQSLGTLPIVEDEMKMAAETGEGEVATDTEMKAKVNKECA